MPDPALRLRHIRCFLEISRLGSLTATAQALTVWFISQGVVRSELNEGSLCSLPLRHEVLGGPMGMSMRDNAIMTPQMQGWVKTIIEAAEQNSSSSNGL